MPSDILEEKQAAALSRILSVCATMLAIFSVFNHFIGFRLLAAVEMASVLAIVALLWQLKSGYSPVMVSHGLLAASLAVLITAFIVGGSNDTGIFWPFLFPMLAFFLFDSWRALMWSIVMFAALGACILLQYTQIMPLPYPPEHISLMIIVLVIAAWLSFLSRQRLDHREALLDTANRELEQEIAWHHATRHHLQIILDYSPIAVWMLRAGKSQFVNHAARLWCLEAGIDGQADDAFYGRFPEEMAKACKRYDEAALASPGRPLLQRTMFPRADRQERITDLIHVCTDPAAAEVVVFAVDVSEQVQAEQKEREMEKRMQHVQKLESLGVMAGGIAHDFNNLLTIVMGNATLAQFEAAENGEVTGMLDNIIRASEEASGLCQQMLAYAGKGALAVTEIDLAEIVRQIGGELAQRFPAGNIRYRYDVASRLPSMRADGAQIRQIILNLVANACEAIGDRSGIITLRASTVELTADALQGMQQGYGMATPGSYLCLEVKDDGCGMDAATMAHLFEPFFSTRFTGRGLGLCAVLGLVQAHSGLIQVHSELGVGTHVSVFFPVIGMAAIAGSAQAVSTAQAAEPQSDTVLLVDDEPRVRDTVSRMLQTLGLQVLTAANGKEALDIVSMHGGDIRLVLLDLTMPGMGGEECLRQLREVQPDLKVVLVSGYSKREAMARFRELALTGFMQKPFSLQKLKHILRDIITEKTAG